MDMVELADNRKKHKTRIALLAGLVVILALIPLFISSPYVLHILLLTFVYTIAAVSLRTITISGQFPLAHAAFMGIGAYLTGMASKWLGWPPALSIILAAVATMGIGMLIGYPFSRLRALYYAIGSLFFGIGVIYIIYAGGLMTGGGQRPDRHSPPVPRYSLQGALLLFLSRAGAGEQHRIIPVRVFAYRHHNESYRAITLGCLERWY